MSFLESRIKRAPTGLRKVLYLNWPLIVLVTAVAAVGILMLWSIAGGDFDVWARRQAQVFGAGLAVMFAIAMVPAWFWRNMAGVAYIVSFVLLLFVEFKGRIGMGAQRWIDLGPIDLQPSEMMKFALVMLLASYYDWLDTKKVSRPLWVLAPVALIVAPTVLVLMQPNLGTSLMLILGGASVMFAAGVSLWYFGGVASLGIGAGGGRVPDPRHALAVPARLPVSPDRHLPRPLGRPAGGGLQHHSGQDRAWVGRLVRQGLHAGHAVAAELPARKAHRLHLHHAGRGIRLCRRLLAAGALCADHRLLPGLGDCRTATGSRPS
jgi:hypothetical protein